MDGVKLKNWKVGKKLGSGACSDVYAVEPLRPLNDKNCDAFVMKLSPLVAIDPAKSKNKKRKKSAAERNADALYAEHLMYQSHLRDHPGLPYIPPGAYGEDKGCRFMVMERLGRTLEAVLHENGPIPSSTAAQLGHDILETLKHIHSKNIVYVDVKPENFMLDMRKENQIYCVDFGIADRYIMATGKHKEYKVGTVVGTPTFLSLNCHAGATASRRDDIEALLNVLIYLIRGDLPWQNASSDSEGAKIKKETSIDVLCKGLPTDWTAMLKKARACGFEDKPEYDFFTRAFVKLGAKAGHNEPFKWGTKAKVVAADPSSRAKEPSPARKKSRAREDIPVPPPQERKPKLTPTKIAQVPTKNGTTDDSSAKNEEKARRHGKPERPSPRAKSPSTAPKKEPTPEATSNLESEDASDVEFVKVGGKDPHRRRKAAARAVAAAAAASAAANQAASTGRYNLRGNSSK